MSVPRMIPRFLRASASPFSLPATFARRSFGSSAIRAKDESSSRGATGDAYRGKVEHFTGGRQGPGPQKPELGVGEMEGITFKVEPLRRDGEDMVTMRARLLYQSRKRGILESDLLLSTFADVYLAKMTHEQLHEYDKFLDENDWDIYYWATQDPPEEGTTPAEDTPTETWKRTGEKSGEWRQTIGAFTAAYRPVPSRWAESEVLLQLRDHVRDNSATGFHAAKNKKTGGSGLGRMPNVQVFDS
ncbi:succinate dehydrogenase assembly factor 2 [Aspergillus nanangensis]|uniref:Succinate dehydrogenase assembly factor 2, mitochondrial n=1 Tax=Aspergillus nanangensis TaxID=2582783 RepID=A0AAD4CSN3_ASPNN|nr:succinate dehydrogenase assembly factor 2 [Aspergillus nanangensis]